MLILNFAPFPILKTGRLILRRLTIEDENEIFFLRSNEAVNRYVDRPKSNSLVDARNHIDRVNNGIDKNESVFWGIALINNQKIVGTICLWNISKEDETADVGFELMPEFQGMGIMQEAFFEVIKYGFGTLRVKKLAGWVHSQNSRSISLLTKFNFVRDECEEEKADKSELANLMIYALSAENYHQMHNF